MMSKIIEFIISNSTIIRDVCWVLFAAIASILSVFTFFNAQKVMRQPLYKTIIKKQIDLYSSILQLIGYESHNLLDSLDVENYIKYNTIGRLSEVGMAFNNEILDGIANAYEKQRFSEDFLEESESIQVYLHDIDTIAVFTEGLVNPFTCEFETCDKEINDFIPGEKIIVNGNVPFLAHTVIQKEFFSKWEKAQNNIYIPVKLAKKMKSLQDSIHKILLDRTNNYIENIIREMASLKENEEYVIDFIEAYNAIVFGDNDNYTKLKRTHRVIRKFIKKKLRIDKKW